MQGTAKERLLTFNFAVLFLTTYFMFFAIDFFIPVLPIYVVEIGGTSAAVGLLMGLFTFSSIILRPIQGRRLNRTGRKKLLLLGIAVYALGGLGLVALPSLLTLFLFRALQGFGWGAFLLAFNTMTLDLAPPERKGEAVSLMGIAPPLSLATAPLISEWIRTGSGNFSHVFIVSIVVALIALGLSLTIKEPPLDQTGSQQMPLFTRKVLLPSVMIFFITFTFGGVITFLPLMGETRQLPFVGAFFTVFALTAISVRFVSGKLSDRWSRAGVFLPGLIILGLSFVVISLAQSLGLLLLGAFLYGCGMSSTHPIIMALAADNLAVGERGVGIATFTLAFDAGIMAGAITLGFLMNWFNFTQIFLLCAAIALLPLIIYLARKIKNRIKTRV